MYTSRDKYNNLSYKVFDFLEQDINNSWVSIESDRYTDANSKITILDMPKEKMDHLLKNYTPENK